MNNSDPGSQLLVILASEMETSFVGENTDLEASGLGSILNHQSA